MAIDPPRAELVETAIVDKLVTLVQYLRDVRDGRRLEDIVGLDFALDDPQLIEWHDRLRRANRGGTGHFTRS